MCSTASLLISLGHRHTLVRIMDRNCRHDFGRAFCDALFYALRRNDLVQPEISWPDSSHLTASFPHRLASWLTYPSWLKSAFLWKPPRITDPSSSNRTGPDSVKPEPSNYWRELNTRSTWSLNRERLRRCEYIVIYLSDIEIIDRKFLVLNKASFASTLRDKMHWCMSEKLFVMIIKINKPVM